MQAKGKMVVRYDGPHRAAQQQEDRRVGIGGLLHRLPDIGKGRQAPQVDGEEFIESE